MSKFTKFFNRFWPVLVVAAICAPAALLCFGQAAVGLTGFEDYEAYDSLNRLKPVLLDGTNPDRASNASYKGLATYYHYVVAAATATSATYEGGIYLEPIDVGDHGKATFQCFTEAADFAGSVTASLNANIVPVACLYPSATARGAADASKSIYSPLTIAGATKVITGNGVYTFDVSAVDRISAAVYANSATQHIIIGLKRGY